jgi:hypothetical protein
MPRKCGAKSRLQTNEQPPWDCLTTDDLFSLQRWKLGRTGKACGHLTMISEQGRLWPTCSVRNGARLTRHLIKKENQQSAGSPATDRNANLQVSSKVFSPPGVLLHVHEPLIHRCAKPARWRSAPVPLPSAAGEMHNDSRVTLRQAKGSARILGERLHARQLCALPPTRLAFDF